MCGRITLISPREEIESFFKAEFIDNSDWKPNYNLGPSSEALVITQIEPHKIQSMLWSPIYDKQTKQSFGFKHPNLRDDSLKEYLNSYSRLLQEQRCVALANGFYEWPKERRGAEKIPRYFKLRTNPLFALAGVWKKIKIENNWIETFAVITTTPNSLLKGVAEANSGYTEAHPFHTRMPVILTQPQLSKWLDSKIKNIEEVFSFLQPCASEKMEGYPVSKSVSYGVNSPECIEKERTLF